MSERSGSRAGINVFGDDAEHVDPSAQTAITGGIRVTILDGAPSFACGDVISVPLRLRQYERYRDPGAFQYADYLLEQGIGAHAATRADRFTRRP